MSQATFEKISRSDKPLYGPRKLLLCGFTADIQPKFGAVLEMAGLADIPKVWVKPEQAHHRLSDLLDLQDETGRGTDSALPRAIIVSGITEKSLHRLMTVCRKSGMKQALWAVLTPTSETWTMQALLNELANERKAMEKRK